MSEDLIQRRRDELQIVSDQVANAYTPEQIGVIQKNVAKDTTIAELAYFLNVCKTMELNPFNKEVWCYKDGRGNLLIFAGRDGFLSKAQKNPAFNGIRSSEVCEKDNFSIDIANNSIIHSHNGKERGVIIGAYAIVFRKGGEPTIEYADFATYNKGYNAWKTHPSEMIKKVPEAHALKKAFGISGVQVEYDWEINQGVAIPNNSNKNVEVEDIEMLFDSVEEHLSETEKINIKRIIDNCETSSYAKTYKRLNEIASKL